MIRYYAEQVGVIPVSPIVAGGNDAGNLEYNERTDTYPDVVVGYTLVAVLQREVVGYDAVEQRDVGTLGEAGEEAGHAQQIERQVEAPDYIEHGAVDNYTHEREIQSFTLLNLSVSGPIRNDTMSPNRLGRVIRLATWVCGTSGYAIPM